jgi:SAM-dependent methyltransferase
MRSSSTEPPLHPEPRGRRGIPSDWEELAQREPYFSVLTEERFLRERMTDEARAEFYASGAADIARLFADIERYLGAPFAPASALDFGCGVGRLTAALARRVRDVAGCDAAASMLRLAETAVPDAVFTVDVPHREFDFICSLIVLQHIPVAEGVSIVERLLARVTLGGVAALHFTVRRPGGALRRLARRVRARVPLVHRIASQMEGNRRGLPYMQMNEYDLDAIIARFRAAGFREPMLVPTNHGGIEGAIVVAQKRSSS